MVTFTVYGVAQSKGNMRAFTPKGMKFPVVTDSNRNAKSWAQLVAQGASDALGESSEARILDGAVRLAIMFYLPRPKKFLIRKWSAVEPPHLTAPDTDKLVRSIGDALAGVLYRDDAQVVELFAMKRYVERDQVPRVTIRVEGIARVQAVQLPPVSLPLFALEGG